MRCPTCSSGTLMRDTRDIPYHYRGNLVVLPQVTGDFCGVCDESVLGADESRRTMALMLAAHAQSSSGKPIQPGTH